MKQVWPAPERNKDPILNVLREVLPATGSVLEIASGSGQHVAHFAAHLPGLTFQPTDFESENLASISAWVQESGLDNLKEPLALDVCAAEWPVGEVDAIYCANMIHIADWSCCIGLFDGTARHLAPRGVLVVYGPFRVAGAHTAPSNASFDESLKARNPSWGVRDVEAVEALAAERGLVHARRILMPANNQCLVFWR